MKVAWFGGLMPIRIREAKSDDFIPLEAILAQHGMLASPAVDGKAAMRSIQAKMGRYFLVAEREGEIVGMIRGCYDGSRALVHQMAVAKGAQRQGVGKRLLHELAVRFRTDGAPSLSVTATADSKRYYAQLGFSDLPITLMVAFDIGTVVKKTASKAEQK